MRKEDLMNIKDSDFLSDGYVNYVNGGRVKKMQDYYRKSKMNKLISEGDIKLYNLLGKTHPMETGDSYFDDEGYYKITSPGKQAFKGAASKMLKRKEYDEGGDVEEKILPGSELDTRVSEFERTRQKVDYTKSPSYLEVYQRPSDRKRISSDASLRENKKYRPALALSDFDAMPVQYKESDFARGYLTGEVEEPGYAEGMRQGMLEEMSSKPGFKAENLGTSLLAMPSLQSGDYGRGSGKLGETSRVKQNWSASQMNRLKADRFGPIQYSTGRFANTDVLGKYGRATAKGLVSRHVEDPDEEGKRYEEKYTSGRNLAKKTRRKQGSLDIQRDKTKKKKGNLVRKTGEGFLGLENRRKFVDGVEETRDTKKERREDRRGERKEARKEKREGRKNKRERREETRKNPQLIFDGSSWVKNPDYVSAEASYKTGGMTKGEFSHKKNPLTVVNKNGQDTGMELTGGEGVFDKQAMTMLESYKKNNNFEAAGKLVFTEMNTWKDAGTAKYGTKIKEY